MTLFLKHGPRVYQDSRVTEWQFCRWQWGCRRLDAHGAGKLTVKVVRSHTNRRSAAFMGWADRRKWVLALGVLGVRFHVGITPAALRSVREQTGEFAHDFPVITRRVRSAPR